MKRVAFRKGTTLVEVLVASILISIAVCGLLFAYIPRTELINDSKLKTQALTLLNADLERMQSIKIAADLTKYLYKIKPNSPVGTVATPIDINNPETQTIDDTVYSLYYSLYSANSNKPYIVRTVETDNDLIRGDVTVLEIEVNVAWKNGDKNEVIKTITRTAYTTN